MQTGKHFDKNEQSRHESGGKKTYSKPQITFYEDLRAITGGEQPSQL